MEKLGQYGEGNIGDAEVDAGHHGAHGHGGQGLPFIGRVLHDGGFGICLNLHRAFLSSELIGSRFRVAGSLKRAVLVF